MAAFQFKKAVKYDSKGRIAFIGPAGSGKSYTMLVALRALVGPTGKIACIDTEHGSLSKYADTFEFDVIELDTFSPDNFMGALKAAEDAGYDAFGCDSLSHFWMGQGGALEFVDNAKRRSSSRDDMSGWKEFSPVERKMIDAMISSPMHIGITMRTKTEYQDQVNERTGKKQRVKIGLAPVQRQGLEYEFDLIGYMDEENNFITDKTRCPFYTQKAISKPSSKAFEPFAEWLQGAKREAAPVGGTLYAIVENAKTKLAEKTGIPEPEEEPLSHEEQVFTQVYKALAAQSGKQTKPFDKFKMLPEIQNLKKRFQVIGREDAYYAVLNRCGVNKSNELPSDDGGLMARVAFKVMGIFLGEMEPPTVAKLPDPIEQVAGAWSICEGKLYQVVDTPQGHIWQESK